MRRAPAGARRLYLSAATAAEMSKAQKQPDHRGQNTEHDHIRPVCGYDRCREVDRGGDYAVHQRG